jgi:hypothetical protein
MTVFVGKGYRHETYDNSISSDTRHLGDVCIRSKQRRRSGNAASRSQLSESAEGTTGMAPNKSGSGTSTSGGSESNGDQGRDTMPDSNKSVKPLSQQHKPEK